MAKNAQTKVIFFDILFKLCRQEIIKETKPLRKNDRKQFNLSNNQLFLHASYNIYLIDEDCLLL